TKLVSKPLNELGEAVAADLFLALDQPGHQAWQAPVHGEQSVVRGQPGQQLPLVVLGAASVEPPVANLCSKRRGCSAAPWPRAAERRNGCRTTSSGRIAGRPHGPPPPDGPRLARPERPGRVGAEARPPAWRIRRCPRGGPRQWAPRRAWSARRSSPPCDRRCTCRWLETCRSRQALPDYRDGLSRALGLR